jgi:hypothetical protein
MFSLLFLSILLIGISDPLIREKEDSRLKRIWLKIFKVPLFDKIRYHRDKIVDKIETKYSSNNPYELLDKKKIIHDLSKYVYYILGFALLLILITIISIFI